MSTELVLAGHTVNVIPMNRGDRRDIEVTPHSVDPSPAFRTTDIIAQLRRFFDAVEAEAQASKGDPVALAQSLARLEALVADVRYVRDTVKALTAESLQAEKVRRFTVQGVITLEGTTEVKRSGWRHADLLADMLDSNSLALLKTATGELTSGPEAAEILLEWFRPEWKMTGVKKAGLDPDMYCELATDDEGKPARTPSVRIHNNEMRTK